MSKKDKKRIAELERQQSILAATVRVMRVQFNTFFDGKISPISGGLLQPEAFQAGTIPSEKQQGETEEKKAEQSVIKESAIQYCNPNKEHWNYAIEANYMQDAPLYVTKLRGFKIHTTPNIAEAERFETAECAQKQIADIKYQGADRGIKPAPFELQVVLIDADKGGAELGGADKE